MVCTTLECCYMYASETLMKAEKALIKVFQAAVLGNFYGELQNTPDWTRKVNKEYGTSGTYCLFQKL